MKRMIPLALIGAAAALTLAASPASAAPNVRLLLNEASTQNGAVETVHWRRGHHRHWRKWRHLRPRHCHWRRVCWINDWGYRKCKLVRRCHRGRHH